MATRMQPRHGGLLGESLNHDQTELGRKVDYIGVVKIIQANRTMNHASRLLGLEK